VGCTCASRKRSGCYSIKFDHSDDIQKYLPDTGTPAILKKSYVNPSKTASKSFGR
jgi:hypothetical protein